MSESIGISNTDGISAEGIANVFPKDLYWILQAERGSLDRLNIFWEQPNSQGSYVGSLDNHSQTIGLSIDKLKYSIRKRLQTQAKASIVPMPENKEHADALELEIKCSRWKIGIWAGVATIVVLGLSTIGITAYTKIDSVFVESLLQEFSGPEIGGALGISIAASIAATIAAGFMASRYSARVNNIIDANVDTALANGRGKLQAESEQSAVPS